MIVRTESHVECERGSTEWLPVLGSIQERAPQEDRNWFVSFSRLFWLGRWYLAEHKLGEQNPMEFCSLFSYERFAGLILARGTVNSNRESERLLGYFGELGELLPWFAAGALA